MTICPICNKEKRFIDTVPTIENSNGEYEYYYRESQPGTVVYLCEKCWNKKFKNYVPKANESIAISTWSAGLQRNGRISITIGETVINGKETFRAREYINEDEAVKLIHQLQKAIRNVNGMP